MADTVYAYFNREFVPIADAKISVMTHALNYGTGCFEGIRAYWNPEEEQLLVFRMHEHYERLLHSMGILMMERRYTADELEHVTVELLQMEGYRTDSYVRPIAYKT